MYIVFISLEAVFVNLKIASLKRIIAVLFTFYIFSPIPFAQGLEEIIVEKYYVSNENDSSVDGDGGVLEVGSVTYRIFVDLKPGYIFQAAFGEPGNELKIESSTYFFNNEDRGNVFPDNGRNRLEDNTVMLDSWVSVGGACEDCIGVLKSNDDGIDTIENGDGVLTNADTSAGIPITEQDGFVSGIVKQVTEVGLSDILGEYLDDTSLGGGPSIISTDNGAWASLEGSMGADSLLNHVLIGQFTTTGDFSFELNIQIRNEQTLEVEKWVANDVQDGEFTHPSLIYTSLSGTVSTENHIESTASKFNFYPNPSSSSICVTSDNIDIKYLERIELYSITGQLLQIYNKIQLDDFSNCIDISFLEDGVYLVSLHSKDGISTEKFIKSK